MKARDAEHTAETQEQIERFRRLGWYHSIELPNGDIIQGHQSLEHQRLRLRQFPIPEDLRGKRVLDIGAWDGWFSFEMEKWGASVVAVDATYNEKLVQAREWLGSKVEYRVADVCDLRPSDLGVFDIVLFLGVLYHLKHPLLALERVCALSRDLVCVESQVMHDGFDPGAVPVMEFYETNELGGQFDNWVGPNVACMLAMCRSAGFARVRFEGMLDDRAHVSCFRKWDSAAGTDPAPYIAGMANTSTLDLSFSASRDEYVSAWFSTTSTGLTADDVFPEAGDYGSRPLKVASAGPDGWEVVFKLPPGLEPGWHPVRLRVRDSAWSNTVLLAVDVNREQRRERTVAFGVPGLEILNAWDGSTWEPNLVRMGAEASITLWARGLGGRSKQDVGVRLDGYDIPVVYLGPPDVKGLVQVNALIPSGIAAGITAVNVAAGGSVSPPVRVKLMRA
jgi:tRNA (mo5U34)-methyltransferase